MTTVTLFDDQSELVDKTRQAMRRRKNVLVQAATGFGKTRLAAHMIDAVRLKGNRAGMLLPRRELLKQTAQTMEKFNIPYGYVASGNRPSPFAPVQLMTGGTLARRLDIAPKLNVLFVDECHFGGAELDKIIRHYQAQGTWVIGLSATPMKTSGQGMGDWYDEMVCGPSIRWLIDNKRLSDFRAFAPNTPDLSAVRSSNGDYVKKDIDEYMSADETGKVIVGNAADHYKKHAYGKLNITFCTSVKNAEMTAQMFNDKGIPSAALHGKMDDSEIKRIIRAFAKREILNITNAQLLAFGFDLSQSSGIDVTIESMSDLAPSQSLPWQCQKWGRPLRMKDEAAILLDHVGNFDRHGLPDSEREWTLEAKEKRGGGSSEKAEPTRQCSECYFVHRPSPCCPACGFVYPIMSREIEEVDGELQEITERPMSIPQHVGLIARQEGLPGLQKYAKEQGYKPSWAVMQMKTRGLM